MPWNPICQQPRVGCASPGKTERFAGCARHRRSEPARDECPRRFRVSVARSTEIRQKVAAGNSTADRIEIVNKSRFAKIRGYMARVSPDRDLGRKFDQAWSIFRPRSGQREPCNRGSLRISICSQFLFYRLCCFLPQLGQSRSIGQRLHGIFGGIDLWLARIGDTRAPANTQFFPAKRNRLLVVGKLDSMASATSGKLNPE